MLHLDDPDDLAAFYDERYAGSYMEEHAPIDIERVVDVLRAVPSGVGAVLDYGCGQGAWLPVLREVFGGADVSGIDISRAAIDKARSRFPSARFDVFDGGRAPFDDASFDLVFSFHVVEHVDDVENTVRDMVRLTRPGGHVVVITPCANAGSWEERLVRRLRDGVERSPTGERRFFFDDPGHLRRLTSDELVALVERAGGAPEVVWFADQRWGALEWLATADWAQTRTIVDLERARSVRDLVLLAGDRAVLRVLAIAIAIKRSRARVHLRERRRLARSLAVLALKPLAFPVAWGLEVAASAEWRRHRSDERGSSQYVIASNQVREATFDPSEVQQPGDQQDE